jgi:hypothetical protein
MGCCSNNEHIAVIINIYIYIMCIYRNIRVTLQGVVIVVKQK